MEHGAGGVVAKAHLIQQQLAAHGPEGLGPGAVGFLHGFAFNGPQALERGLTLLQLVEVGGEVANRIDQHQQGSHIAAEALAIQALGLDARCSHQQHRENAGRFDEAHHRVLQGQQAQGAVAGLAMQVDFGVEPLLEPGFRGKGPHQGQAADGFAEEAGQVTHLFLAALGCAHHPGAKAAHQQGHDRGQQQGGQGQGPVEPHHVAQHHHQLQGTGGGVLDGLVNHLPHPVGVFGEPVGEIAGGQLFQRPKIQGLQPGKQAAAQLLAHPQGWPCQEDVLAELGGLLHHENHQGRPNRAGHGREVAGANGGNQLTGQPGQQGPAGHKNEHAQPTQQQATAVGLQQRPEGAKAGR